MHNDFNEISIQINEKYKFDSENIKPSFYDFKYKILDYYKKQYPMKIISNTI